MSDPAEHPLESILKQCAARAPDPWYPQTDGLGLPRARLDPLLDELRLGGLLRLTDWVQGKGQGYALTPAGAEAIRSASVLARLRRGEVPVAKPPKQEETPERASLTFRRTQDIRKAIESSARPVVTQALLYLNIAVFLVGCYVSWQQLGSAEPFILGKNGAGPVLHATGALHASDLVPGGQWWRLVSCFFVHIGVIHLLVNMWTLWVFGPLLEKLWGRWTFLSLYLVSGLCASLAIASFPGAGGVTAGASGALWGMMTSLGVWYFLNRKAIDPAVLRSHSRQLFSILLINVIITFVVPNISVSGHLGGGLAGLLASFPVDYARYHPGWRRYLARAALPFLVIVYFSFFLQTFAAPQYLQVIRRTAYEGGVLYNRGALGLLEPDPKDRQLSPERRQVIEQMIGQLRSVIGQSWVGHFGDANYREKVEAGVQLLRTLQQIFEGLLRSAQAPESWTQADEDELMEQRGRLVELYRRWTELTVPDRKQEG